MQKDYVIKHSQKKRLLEIFTDMKLNVQCQIENLCTQVSWKLGALERALLYQELSKRKILVNAYFSSQFNYYSLVWIFNIPALNSKLNRLHEKCLRLIYNDMQSTFEQLLDKESYVHISNLQTQFVEMYRVVNGSTP